MNGKTTGWQRHLILQNKKGCSLSLLLREYHPGDETGIIACIRDEYGSTYFKRNFYIPEQIRNEAESGHITFLEAETEAGEIAGMLILKQFYPKESMCEIASQIFRRKYRGYGLAVPFFEYGMEILKSRHYSAAYCLPVLFHDTTQRLLYRLGFRATGFVLNVFDMGRITHSYKRDRNRKHSQGIQIMAQEKRDAGTLYLPPEHIDICKKIYDSLEVEYRICEESGLNTGIKRGILLPAISSITVRQDENQSSLVIHIHCIGTDLLKRMEAIHRKYPLTGLQTANVFLNINDRNAVWAYRQFKENGYFFTGIKPLCSDREYMILHNSGEVEFYLEDYVVTEEFTELIKYIEIMERRKGMKIIKFESKEALAELGKKQIEKIKAANEEVNEDMKTGVADLKVFRDDERTVREIEAEGGFYPSGGKKEDQNEDWVADARELVEKIFTIPQERLSCFINAWKYTASDVSFEAITVGKRGKHAGICCGLNEGQKGSQSYMIDVPIRLYPIKAYKSSNISIVTIYGDSIQLEECKVLAMNLKSGVNIEEFVFLTPVPLEWIGVVEKE